MSGQLDVRRSNVSGKLTGTAWLPAGELGLEDWVENGRRFGAIGRASAWWIGDWLRYGNMAFGERYARASRITGYDTQTLMNMVYVASAIPPEERHEALSWSHHAEVAALPREERARWLGEAAQHRMSVRCLRAEVRKHRPRNYRLRRGDAHERKALPETTAAATSSRAEQQQCPHCGHALLAAAA